MRLPAYRISLVAALLAGSVLFYTYESTHAATTAAAAAKTAPAPAPPLGTYPPGTNLIPPSADYIAAHPKDIHVVVRTDGDGIVTLFAESEHNLEFTITLDVNLTNATSSKPLPITVDSAGQKSIEIVQIIRTKKGQPWHYQYTSQSRPGARREEKTNDAVYLLPYSPKEAHVLMQGNFGKFSHYAGSPNEYAFDFKCDPGTLIYSARAGIITGIRQDFTLGGADKGYESMANYIIIKHADGTFAEYLHIQHNGALVHLGEKVGAGQPIAMSGATGYVTGPHIHFCVFQNIDGKDRVSLLTKFKTASGVLDTLKQGTSY